MRFFSIVSGPVVLVASTVSSLAGGIPIAPLPGAEPNPKNDNGIQWALRNEFKASALLHSVGAEQGAKFSLSQNRLSRQETFALNGAISAGWRESLNDTGFTEFAYSAGLFGQIYTGSGVAHADRIDKLGVGVGMAWAHETDNEDAVLKHGVLETQLSWITDSDLELSVFKAASDYKPFFTGSSREPFRRTANGNTYCWGPIFAVDYFRVMDGAGLAEYSESSDYFYVGGGVTGEYKFMDEDKERLIFSGDYQLQYDVAGGGGMSEYLKLNTSLPIGDKEGFSFDITYERGQRPLGKGEVDHLVFGVSLKLGG